MAHTLTGMNRKHNQETKHMKKSKSNYAEKFLFRTNGQLVSWITNDGDGTEPSTLCGESLIVLRDDAKTKPREIVLTGEEADDLAQQWLALRSGALHTHTLKELLAEVLPAVEYYDQHEGAPGLLKAVRNALKPSKKIKPRVFPFLVTANIRDGENERTDYCMIRARGLRDANKRAGKLFQTNSYGMDTDKAYFGKEDQTITTLESVKQITEAEAETVERLGVVFFA